MDEKLYLVEQRTEKGEWRPRVTATQRAAAEHYAQHAVGGECRIECMRHDLAVAKLAREVARRAFRRYNMLNGIAYNTEVRAGKLAPHQ